MELKNLKTNLDEETRIGAIAIIEDKPRVADAIKTLLKMQNMVEDVVGETLYGTIYTHNDKEKIAAEVAYRLIANGKMDCNGSYWDNLEAMASVVIEDLKDSLLGDPETDTVRYGGEHTVRILPDGTVVGPDYLEEVLLKKDGNYADDLAREIYDGINYFVPEDMLSLIDYDLVSYINEYIDMDFKALYINEMNKQ